LFDRRAYGPEKLSSVTQKDFCNTIGGRADKGRALPTSAFWLLSDVTRLSGYVHS